MSNLSGKSRTLSMTMVWAGATLLTSAACSAQTTTKPAPRLSVPTVSKPVAPKPAATRPAVMAAAPAARPGLASMRAPSPVAAGVAQPSQSIVRTTPASSARAFGSPAVPVSVQPATAQAPAQVQAQPMAGTTRPAAAYLAQPATVTAQPGLTTSQPAPAYTVSQPASSTAPSAGSLAGTASSLSSSYVPTGTTDTTSTARSANFAAGLGTFQAYGVTLTAFGCFRATTRVFCDFDLSSDTRSQQVSANEFHSVMVVADGGRLMARHAGFFLAADGSQMQQGYMSPGAPLRYVMEYDDVPAQIASATLVYGSDKIPGVGLTAMDPNQAPGTMPVRAAAGAQTAQTDPNAPAPVAASSSLMDKASSTVNAATTNKAKAQSMWQQMKPTSQPTH